MDDFLAKPVALEDLRATLARWLPVAEASADAGAASLSPEAMSRILEMEHGGRSGFLRKVSSLFRDTSARQIHTIMQAAADGRLSTVATECHSLKSACAHVGADALARLAIETERAAIAADAARVASLVVGMSAARAAAVEALANELARRTA
jgi:HPt (histidine-containing phosphotransfer) domain-containing protein